MSFVSALYDGVVVHRRFGARTHALRYRMRMVLLDLDEVDALVGRFRLFSRNRFNLVAFHDADHPIGDPGQTLRAQVEARLAEAGIALEGGPIRLLSLPRVLGYAFNPLSVFFCYRPDLALVAILYEVRNTFHQRHTYLIPVDRASHGEVRQACAKVFYVSPFMDMDLTYAFRVVPPGGTVSIAVDAQKAGTRVLAASFAGSRRPLSDGALLRAVLGHPLMAVAVIAAIHWEALKMWLTGFRLRERPPPPEQPISIIAREEIEDVIG